MPGPGFYFYGDEERKEVEEVLSAGYLSRYGKEDDPAFKHKVFSLEEAFARIHGGFVREQVIECRTEGIDVRTNVGM